MPYPPATLTGAGWIVDPIVNPKSGVPSPTPPYGATLGVGGWTVDSIVKPVDNFAYQLSAMFAQGMKGIWRESSKAGTSFAESTGLTPVSPGSTAGLVLSLDQGGGRGDELVTVPNVSLGSSGLQIASASPLVAGRTYEVFATVSGYSGTGDLGFDSPNFVATPGGTRLSGNGVMNSRVQAATASVLRLFTRSTNAATFSNVSVREVPGNHQRQASASFLPLYQISPPRLVFDGVDDVLNTTFATALGANCTVGRYVPGTGPVILTGQNIGTSFADSVTSGPLVVLNGPLNAGQTAALTAYLTEQGMLP